MASRVGSAGGPKAREAGPARGREGNRARAETAADKKAAYQAAAQRAATAPRGKKEAKQKPDVKQAGKPASKALPDVKRRRVDAMVDGVPQTAEAGRPGQTVVRRRVDLKVDGPSAPPRRSAGPDPARPSASRPHAPQGSGRAPVQTPPALAPARGWGESLAQAWVATADLGAKAVGAYARANEWSLDAKQRFDRGVTESVADAVFGTVNLVAEVASGTANMQALPRGTQNLLMKDVRDTVAEAHAATLRLIGSDERAAAVAEVTQTPYVPLPQQLGRAAMATGAAAVAAAARGDVAGLAQIGGEAVLGLTGLAEPVERIRKGNWAGAAGYATPLALATAIGGPKAAPKVGQQALHLGERVVADAGEVAAAGQRAVDALARKLPPPQGGLRLAVEGAPAGAGLPASMGPNARAAKPPTAPQALKVQRSHSGGDIDGLPREDELGSWNFVQLGERGATAERSTSLWGFEKNGRRVFVDPAEPSYVKDALTADKVYTLFGGKFQVPMTAPRNLDRGVPVPAGAAHQALEPPPWTGRGIVRMGEFPDLAIPYREFVKRYEGQPDILRPVLLELAEALPVDVVVNNSAVLGGAISSGVQIVPVPGDPRRFRPVRIHYGEEVFDRLRNGNTGSYYDRAMTNFNKLIETSRTPVEFRFSQFETLTQPHLAHNILHSLAPKRTEVLATIPLSLRLPATHVLDQMVDWARDVMRRVNR